MTNKQEDISYSPKSEEITEILNKILETLQLPENITKLQEARDNIGNEMMKMMQLLFPIVMNIQMDVIQSFGYSVGKEGLMKFVKTLKVVERDDPEVARLHGLIKAYYLPSVAVNTNNDSLAEDIINSC